LVTKQGFHSLQHINATYPFDHANRFNYQQRIRVL
jgi:hypothetical protein